MSDRTKAPRIYRAIAGAVRNVADSHPLWPITHPCVANSIAKRATGTLVAQLQSQGLDALAATPLSERRLCAPLSRDRQRGVPTGPARLAPLRRVHRELSRMVKPALLAGNTARAAALVDALRLIGAEIEGGAR